jgi:DNA (cytosine-5)-methyltransferase 1
MDGTPTERRGGAPSGVRRLCADQPSKAITAAAPREFLHPTEHRLLTLRECARLQTFPDDYVFRGSKADRALLVGNAVPPRLAEVFARALLDDMRQQLPSDRGGALLTFVPTLSEGMSPVLEDVVRKVARRFLARARRESQRLLWD